MDGDDLILNGEIILEGDVLPHDFCQYMESGCFSARMVREALAGFDGDVTVRVNSAGGSPYEGEAIRSAFEAHRGRVTVIVGGVAASAASLMIMSADRIEMSAGSFLMIHNPSSCICGTAEQMRREAEDLDRLAQVYASVYAARCGRTADEVMRMMNDVTWFGPADAVAAGFADGIVGEEPEADATLTTIMALHQRSIANLRMCAKKFHGEGNPPSAQPTATAGQPQASTAATEEVHMDPEDDNAAVTPPTPQAPATTQTTMRQSDEEAIASRAMQAERTRQSSIRQMARPFMASGQLTEAQVDRLIEDGTTAETAGNRMMTFMAQAEPLSHNGGPRARITRDEGETRMEGMIQAMMRDYTGPGEQYRGMRLRGLAMELSGSNRSFSDNDTIRSGMRSTTMMGGAHGVSDFAYVTTEVMNRSLVAEYERRGANWQIVTGTPMTASDFRELHAVRFGGDFQLKTVKENGEYQEATLSDEAEGLKVERRGRTIHLTFEAVVNDDMGAFNRIPREFAMASRVMEASMVWSLMRTNAKLKSDGKALFHADHKNLAAAAAAISVASVGLGRKALWEQTAYGSKDADDFLMVEPNLLIVPPALEVTALQFATATTPGKDADANPYKGTLRPVTIPNLGTAAGGSDTSWYLVSEDLPPISVAYLEGYEAPTVQTIEGMNPDKVTMNARHIFGAAASEFRGAYKNAGA
ncbi:MAG: Clp protease ClpP [Alteromonadaceae bacterium]|nr:Clp protease ClpP [Alteromonadaceae bacterium]